MKKDASGLENAEGANTDEPSVDDPRISRIASKLLKRKEFKAVKSCVLAGSSSSSSRDDEESLVLLVNLYSVV